MPKHSSIRCAACNVPSPPAAEQPEHRGDRRRFLVWALMIGATTPERVTERIVAELEREAGA